MDLKTKKHHSSYFEHNTGLFTTGPYFSMAYRIVDQRKIFRGSWPELDIQPVPGTADFFVDQGMLLDSG